MDLDRVVAILLFCVRFYLTMAQHKYYPGYSTYPTSNSNPYTLYRNNPYNNRRTINLDFDFGGGFSPGGSGGGDHGPPPDADLYGEGKSNQHSGTPSVASYPGNSIYYQQYAGKPEGPLVILAGGGVDYQYPPSQNYGASSGLEPGPPPPPPVAPVSSPSLLTRPVSSLALGLSSVMDTISVSIMDRTAKRLMRHYPPPPPPMYYYPQPVAQEAVAEASEDDAANEVESKKSKKKTTSKTEKKTEDEEESASTITTSNRFKDWPKLFSIMGSGVDGFFEGVHMTRKEIAKMTGQIVSNGLLMGGEVVNDVTNGMAHVIQKAANVDLSEKDSKEKQ